MGFDGGRLGCFTWMLLTSKPGAGFYLMLSARRPQVKLMTVMLYRLAAYIRRDITTGDRMSALLKPIFFIFYYA